VKWLALAALEFADWALVIAVIPLATRVFRWLRHS